MIIRSGKVTYGQSVFLRRFAEKIESRDAAGTRHVLNDDCRITWNVLGQMTRNDSSFDIRRPAGGEVNEEGYILSLVKGRLRRICGSKKQTHTESNRQRHSAGKLHKGSPFPSRFSGLGHFRNDHFLQFQLVELADFRVRQ